jgi:formate/nitrite transporter FocA (FNT family)
VGGIDVGLGVFALLLVHAETGNVLLSALAFGIGFIAVTLAKSELFTENFLVPIAAAVATKSPSVTLLRLWSGTALTNLAGGWVLMWIVIGGLPRLGPTAVEVARFYPELGIGWRSFALALLGGTVITLMTWMERGTRSVPAKLIAAMAAAFVLATAPLNHAIVVSLEMFAALQAGAPFGYADWLGVLGWAALGNMVGGIGLVTVLRLIQVGRGKLEEETERGGAPRTSDGEAGTTE